MSRKPRRSARVSFVVVLQPVEVFEIERERTFAAVDFDLDAILSAEREPRRFVVRECAVLETSDEHHRVVYCDLALLR